jgi:hypothetical protein
VNRSAIKNNTHWRENTHRVALGGFFLVSVIFCSVNKCERIQGKKVGEVRRGGQWVSVLHGNAPPSWCLFKLINFSPGNCVGRIRGRINRKSYVTSVLFLDWTNPLAESFLIPTNSPSRAWRQGRHVTVDTSWILNNAVFWDVNAVWLF